MQPDCLHSTSRARPLCKPLSTSSHQLSKVAANCCQSCAAGLPSCSFKRPLNGAAPDGAAPGSPADAVARASRHDHDAPDNTRCLAPWVCSTRALSGLGSAHPRSNDSHARLPPSTRSARPAPARSCLRPPAHAPHPFLANRGAGAGICSPYRKWLPTARTEASGIIA